MDSLTPMERANLAWLDSISPRELEFWVKQLWSTKPRSRTLRPYAQKLLKEVESCPPVKLVLDGKSVVVRPEDWKRFLEL